MPDFAVDIEVEIVEGEKVTNKVFWVQIKATNSVKRSNKTIPFSMKTKYLEHYERCRLPVIILLWVKCNNSFYYLFAQRYILEKLSVERPDWRAQKTNTIEFSQDSKLENVATLSSIATEGYLYIIQQELNVKPETGTAIYWLDGIPKSDDEELKNLTLEALLHIQKERHKDAILVLEDIMRVCTTSPTEKMSIFLSLGNAHYRIGQYDEALNAYKAILRLAKKVSEQDAIVGGATALGNIGIVYLDKGDSDKALKYQKAALKIDREIGYKRGEVADLANIGVVYRVKGDLDKALKNHEAALKICRDIGHKEAEAAALNNIGRIYRVKDDLDGALKHLRAALKIHREIGHKKYNTFTFGQH